MYSITTGMSRVFNRKSKRTCASCGLVVPVYPGRYPRNCPHCDTPFMSDKIESIDDFLVDEVLEMLINEEISFGKAIERIEEQDQGDDEFHDKTDRKVLAFDRFMQLVSMSKLLDQLVGVKVQGVGSNIWAYFSDQISEKKIKDFLDKVTPYAQSAQLYPSDEEGSKWVISILNAVRDRNPEITGTVDSEVDVTGETEVSVS